MRTLTKLWGIQLQTAPWTGLALEETGKGGFSLKFANLRYICFSCRGI